MSEDKKEIILKAAKRAFAEKGFAAVGIREVAREAGLNSATLYHYFKNKEGIYTAILEETFDKIVGILHEIAQMDLEPGQQLGYGIDRYIDFIMSNRDVLKILIHELNLETSVVGEVMANSYSTFYSIAQEMMERKRGTEGVREVDPKHLFIAVMGMCVIYFVISPLFETMEKKDQLSPEMLTEWKKSVSDLVLHGILKP